MKMNSYLYRRTSAVLFSTVVCGALLGGCDSGDGDTAAPEGGTATTTTATSTDSGAPPPKGQVKVPFKMTPGSLKNGPPPPPPPK